MGSTQSTLGRRQDSKQRKKNDTNYEKQDVFQMKKRDQGYHECEVFGRGPEATESATAWEECTKNPDHASFIPAPKFCLYDLPIQCRGQEYLEYVKIVSDRTVRLRVTYTSPERPHNYTFSCYRGTDILHTASGWIYDVKPGEGTCPCPECLHSSSPAQKYHLVCMVTACHAVYNSEEAKSTKVDFFYHDEQSLEDGRMRTLQGCFLAGRNVHGDNCMFYCATHDQLLIRRLKDLLWETSMCVVSLMKRKPLSRPNEVCVIVSHPHGQSKQITVGKTLSLSKRFKSSKFKVTYSTDTCPGSSGGPVLMFDANLPYPASWTASHSLGNFKKGVNKSASTGGTRVRLYTDPSSKCHKL